jgi:RimJ/RimL family protein N-acetyltransferase
MTNAESTLRYRVIFRDINPDDFAFAYELYQQRPKESIVDGHVITRAESDTFNAARPYKKDVIANIDGGERIGRVVLDHDNSIGIDIAPKYQRLGYGKIALEQFLYDFGDGEYIANISPKNVASISFFESLGFQLKKLVYVKKIKGSSDD